MTGHRSRAPGYQPRDSSYLKRASSIDGVLNAVSSPGQTPVPIIQPAAITPSEPETFNFSPVDVLQHKPQSEMTFKSTKPKPRKHKAIRPPHKRHVAAFAVLFVVFLGMVSGGVVIRKNRGEVKSASITIDNQTVSAATLEELPPTATDINTYSVDPGLPRVLRIRQLGIETRIYRTGLQSDGQLNIVRNIYDTGWYDHSGKPGDSAPVLIAGHSHGPTKPGIFYNLDKLTPGVQIEVERGDGRVFRYQITVTKQFRTDQIDLKSALAAVDQGKAGLNLITYPGLGLSGGQTSCFLVFAAAIY